MAGKEEKELVGKALSDAFKEIKEQDIANLQHAVIEKGETYFINQLKEVALREGKNQKSI